MQRRDLEQLSREELVAKAESAGIARARTLTIAELVDELSLAEERRTGERRPRGWFGRARDLLTSVIDRGLTIPEAPKRRTTSRVGNAAPPPLPTVTLAEIYAAQGHVERAISTLDEVLANEPGHEEAIRLRDRFQAQLRKTKPSSAPPAPQVVALTQSVDGSGSNEADSLAVGSNVEIGDGVAVDPAPRGDAPGGDTSTDQPPLLAEEQTFDVDEVVAVAVDPHTVYVYWEVRPRTFAAARGRAPEGALVVRVVAISASPTGPSTDTRDIRVDALFGELFVRGLPQGAQVRLSIGYSTPGGFEPFAVGLELTTPRARPAAQAAGSSRRWSEVRAEVEDTTRPRPTASAEVAPNRAAVEHRSEAPPALPSPAWLEAPRLVQVSEPDRSGTFRHVSFHRLPGSSEIFRKEAFFSRGPFRHGGVDSHGFSSGALG